MASWLSDHLPFLRSRRSRPSPVGSRDGAATSLPRIESAPALPSRPSSRLGITGEDMNATATGTSHPSVSGNPIDHQNSTDRLVGDRASDYFNAQYQSSQVSRPVTPSGFVSPNVIRMPEPHGPAVQQPTILATSSNHTESIQAQQLLAPPSPPLAATPSQQSLTFDPLICKTNYCNLNRYHFFRSTDCKQHYCDTTTMNPDTKWKAQIFGPDNEEQRATSREPRSTSPLIYGTRRRGRMPPAPTKPRASRSAPFPLRDATWSSFDQGGPSRMEEDTMRETREEGLPLPRIEDWGTAESDKTLTDIGSQVGEEVEEQREDVERRSSQTPPTKLDKGKAREASPQIEDGLVEDTMFELLGITDPERAAHIRKKAMEITDEAFKAAGMEANQTSKKYIEIFRRNIHRLAEIYGNLKDNKSPGGETPMERLGERYHEKWNNERPTTSQGVVEQLATTLLPPIQMGIHQPQPHHPIQIKTEYATSIGTSMDTLGKAYKSLYEPPREDESAIQYKTRLEAQD
ncbi:hypothetical protein AGABI1DRAFT_95508 [Agaricus bisporus var. burnettii JB137-S8]|uniref:Uncharacterized protein n=1 Tax=Agaricus bisporus var. burnettii (strain JB137-S8 / ATCC MYA-4627 / FGSC 10392) TaxID=597362 RepID=K5WHA1_AGABU|nr:uncharacterized protein AGABI1DRAFT_95508 [Agaricus bisporus var. burnettii JB137-S8]EKM74616.1 hypothetical protein AGABI1DRAFT_95508 [Agaricus bisporus var. burnettii JB137-S8]